MVAGPGLKSPSPSFPPLHGFSVKKKKKKLQEDILKEWIENSLLEAVKIKSEFSDLRPPDFKPRV